MVLVLVLLLVLEPQLDQLGRVQVLLPLLQLLLLLLFSARTAPSLSCPPRPNLLPLVSLPTLVSKPFFLAIICLPSPSMTLTQSVTTVVFPLLLLLLHRFRLFTAMSPFPSQLCLFNMRFFYRARGRKDRKRKGKR